MPDDLPTIGGFLRTCAKDVDLFTYAMRSICRFGFPLLATMTITYAPRDADVLERLLRGAFPWAHHLASDSDESIGARVLNLTGHAASTAYGKSFFRPGLGYMAQIIDKLRADELIRRATPSGVQHAYIMYFDSDNLLTRTLVPSDVFTRQASSWVLRLPAITYKRLGVMHEHAWRSLTAHMLGVPRTNITLSFMCRHGGLLFPVWEYEPLRARLLSVLGETLFDRAAHLLSHRTAAVGGDGGHHKPTHADLDAHRQYEVSSSGISHTCTHTHTHTCPLRVSCNSWLTVCAACAPVFGGMQVSGGGLTEFELLGGYLYYLRNGGGVVWEYGGTPWNSSSPTGFPVEQVNSWNPGVLTTATRTRYDRISSLRNPPRLTMPHA